MIEHARNPFDISFLSAATNCFYVKSKIQSYKSTCFSIINVTESHSVLHAQGGFHIVAAIGV